MSRGGRWNWTRPGSPPLEDLGTPCGPAEPACSVVGGQESAPATSAPKMIPTPEQARELVEHFGGQRAAARALGVAKSTLRYWLDPEKDRAAARHYRLNNLEKELARSRRYYDNLSWFDRNRKQLQDRRRKALKRMKERHDGELPSFEELPPI